MNRLVVSITAERTHDGDVSGINLVVWGGFTHEVVELDAGFLDGVGAGGADDPVGQMGDRVWQHVSQMQCARTAVEQAVQGLEELAIRLRFGEAGEVEALPFEAIRYDGRFLALDRRWPVVREARATARDEPRIVELPLRVAVVIAAKDVDGAAELEALHAGLAAHGVDCEVTVFTSQESARAQAEEYGWTTATVPASVADLDKALAKLRPRLAHILCHGSPGGALHLANRTTLDDGPALEVGARDLSGLAQQAVVVTVNACHSGAGDEESASVAVSLVGEGVPAVFAHRRPIDTGSANTVCKSLYGTLPMALVGGDDAGARRLLDLRDALVGARNALLSGFGQGTEEQSQTDETWTLPLLYRTPHPVELECERGTQALADAKAGLLAELATCKRYLAEPPEGTSDAWRENVEVRIAEIKDRLIEIVVLQAGGN